jgi:hypothetical protein
MSQNVTEGEEIHSDRAAEVSRGQSRSCSRQGYGGTPKPKGGANKIGRAGNDDPKARTVPRKGNKGKGK